MNRPISVFNHHLNPNTILPFEEKPETRWSIAAKVAVGAVVIWVLLVGVSALMPY